MYPKVISSETEEEFIAEGYKIKILMLPAIMIYYFIIVEDSVDVGVSNTSIVKALERETHTGHVFSTNVSGNQLFRDWSGIHR
ncbi:hypothetical protein TNCV_2897641 [Trichonephila clavipes]|nr:hypothetical protein TNCV_2897641 [Trichonephila clavipes]